MKQTLAACTMADMKKKGTLTERQTLTGSAVHKEGRGEDTKECEQARDACVKNNVRYPYSMVTWHAGPWILSLNSRVAAGKEAVACVKVRIIDKSALGESEPGSSAVSYILRLRGTLDGDGNMAIRKISVYERSARGLKELIKFSKDDNALRWRELFGMAGLKRLLINPWDLLVRALSVKIEKDKMTVIVNLKDPRIPGLLGGLIGILGSSGALHLLGGTSKGPRPDTVDDKGEKENAFQWAVRTIGIKKAASLIKKGAEYAGRSALDLVPAGTRDRLPSAIRDTAKKRFGLDPLFTAENFRADCLDERIVLVGNVREYAGFGDKNKALYAEDSPCRGERDARAATDCYATESGEAVTADTMSYRAKAILRRKATDVIARRTTRPEQPSNAPGAGQPSEHDLNWYQVPPM